VCEREREREREREEREAYMQYMTGDIVHVPYDRRYSACTIWHDVDDSACTIWQARWQAI